MGFVPPSSAVVGAPAESRGARQAQMAEVVTMTLRPHRYHRKIQERTAMRFTKDHEWVELDGDVATIGITGYAADQLGDVVFVDLPAVGKDVRAGEAPGGGRKRQGCF
jgi:hypothetical protein